MKEEKNRWFVEIEKVDNGYILKKNSDERGVVTKLFQIKTIFAETEKQDKLEKEELMNVFQEIMEYFGVFNQKYDTYHLYIEVVRAKE